MKLKLKIFFFVIFCKIFVARSNEGRLEPKWTAKNLSLALVKLIDEVWANEKKMTVNFIKGTADPKNIFLNDVIDEVSLGSSLLAKITFQIESINSFKYDSMQPKSSTIFLMETFQDFIETRSIITSKMFRLRSGNFLIVLLNGKIKEIEEIFREFWKLRVFNANVVFVEKSGIVVVQTFKLFSKDNCQDMNPITVNEFRNGNFVNDLKNIFPQKMKNLQNCPVTISIATDIETTKAVRNEPNGDYKLSGLDIELINLLAESLNFRPNFTFIGPIGFFSDNKSAEGPLKALVEGKSEFSVCTWLLKPNRLKFFDSSVPYMSGPINFIVPPGREFSALEKIISPFSAFLWASILVCYLIGFIVILVINRQTLRIQNFVFGPDTRNPHLNMFAGFIGATQKILPTQNFSRFLLTMLLIYALVIRSLYQGSFFNIMQSNKHHKQVQSVDEMARKGFTFFVVAASVDLLQGIEVMKNRFDLIWFSFASIIVKIFRVAGIDKDDKALYLKKIRNDPQFKGAYGQSLLLTIYDNRVSAKDARNRICTEVIYNLPCVIYTQKDFYLLDAINEKIGILHSSGILPLITSFLLDLKYVDEKFVSNEENRSATTLTLPQVFGCFELLLFGISISFVAFLIEISIARIFNTRVTQLI